MAVSLLIVACFAFSQKLYRIAGQYWIYGCAGILAVGLAYWFVFRSNKHNPAVTGGCLVLLFSAFFSLTTPVLDVPDEHAHFRRSVLTADLVLFPQALDDEGRYPAYEGTEQLLIQSFKEPLLESMETSMDMSDAGSGNVMAVNFFAGYLPQALGVRIGLLLGLPSAGVLLVARLVNGLTAALLTVLAVSITPKYKHLFVIMACLPWQVYLAGSVSVDMFVDYGSLLVVALFLNLQAKKQISMGQILLFSGLAFLVAVDKLTYGAWIFLLPALSADQLAFKNGKKKIWLICGVFAILLIVWFLFVRVFPEPWEFQERFAVEQVNPVQQIKWILAHPLQTGKIILTTMVQEMNLSMFMKLGWLTYWNVWVNGACLLLVLSQALYAKNAMPDKRVRLAALFILLAVYGGTYLIEYIQWTAVGAARVEGVQMRYFLPLCILIPWILNAKIRIQNVSLLNTVNLLWSVTMLSLTVCMVLGQYYIL